MIKTSIDKVIKGLCFESDRLVTKPLQRSDAERIFEIYSNSEAMKFRANPPMTSIKDAERMIADQEINNCQSIRVRQGIWKRNQDDLIGTVLLIMQKNERNKIEVGLSIDKKYWRMGFGLETLQMIEGELTSLCLFTDIYAWIYKGNLGSAKLFAKAGFLANHQDKYPESLLYTKNIAQRDNKVIGI